MVTFVPTVAEVGVSEKVVAVVGELVEQFTRDPPSLPSHIHFPFAMSTRIGIPELHISEKVGVVLV